MTLALDASGGLWLSPTLSISEVWYRLLTRTQALIDGPTTSVPRQSFPYRNLILTPYTLASLPRAAGSGAIKKAIEKAGVLEKWEQSGWAKKLAARQVRKVCRGSSSPCQILVVVGNGPPAHSAGDSGPILNWTIS
jgi:hypothetical protein